MANLTKEYFDKQLNKLVSRRDFSDQIKKLSTKEDILSTKEDILFSTKKDIEELARITSKGFEDVIKRLDVRERVEKLERQMETVKGALNL